MMMRQWRNSTVVVVVVVDSKKIGSFLDLFVFICEQANSCRLTVVPV